MAWCDPDRIYRVFLNIVGNAIKFQGTEIVLRVYADQSGVIWECRDNGIGINPEKLHLMGKEFERLVHGDGAPGGTGIGLHFCGIIVGLSKGEITYFSDGEGKGTTVSLFLPRPPQTVIGVLPELLTEV
jgi:signal transduction histidine kinase